LQACSQWELLRAPLRLHRFEGSGVLAVISTSFDSDKARTHPSAAPCAHASRCRAQVNKALVDLACEQHDDGIGVIEAAQLVGLAPPLAREQLLAAEAVGALCRDEAPSGVRFFANRFVETA
jgi:hypothetical protein